MAELDRRAFLAIDSADLAERLDPRCREIRKQRSKPGRRDRLPAGARLAFARSLERPSVDRPGPAGARAGEPLEEARRRDVATPLRVGGPDHRGSRVQPAAHALQHLGGGSRQAPRLHDRRRLDRGGESARRHRLQQTLARGGGDGVVERRDRRAKRVDLRSGPTAVGERREQRPPPAGSGQAAERQRRIRRERERPRLPAEMPRDPERPSARASTGLERQHRDERRTKQRLRPQERPGGIGDEGIEVDARGWFRLTCHHERGIRNRGVSRSRRPGVLRREA